MIIPLVAVGIGCDVFDGITGVGNSLLDNELNWLKTTHLDDNVMISRELDEFMIKKDEKKLKKEKLITITHAFIYEPANEYSKLKYSGFYTHIIAIYNRPYEMINKVTLSCWFMSARTSYTDQHNVQTRTTWSSSRKYPRSCPRKNLPYV